MLSSPSASDLRLRDFPKLVAIRRDAARRAKLFAHPDLTYLFWESTLRCNLRCTHCGSSCEASSPVRELTTEQVLRFVDEVADDFDARRIFVSITGGEPLLRPDLYPVVERMTHRGMRSCIVTNGTLLGACEAARLFDCGMRTVTVSIDGTREQHEAVRGTGTYRKALAAITRAREAGFQVVEAITCVRPANLDNLGDIERAVRGAGANLWRLITIDRMGRQAGPADQQMWLEPSQVVRLLDFIDRRRQELARSHDAFGVQFSCGGFLGPRRELAVRPGDGQCFAGLCVASILCDGLVSACPSLPRSWAQGSVLEERLSAIWRTRFQAFRDTSWRRTGVCADCSWFDICQGGGLHERLAQPESFCWLDRQGG
ncbi:MAG: radical SAM protein [Polyangiaceae bacterium]|jgi:radical SAM protein with 4Fe4S-binding SPASM domain|nr:radical SAM protein [Polyangiaceae bacterium]